ncbi:hypothetical protein GCM10010497_25500 [Streptomyces cinereoruber]|uniref:Uncharacterized protein n=1 Tax=Streptomyces cinereoruber TaxID=67260 RepID=A0AAV4KIQ6_9ACTN|nr:hypothetical protein GCM10010497_25500 [Streptomyces cinereoruber]
MARGALKRHVFALADDKSDGEPVSPMTNIGPFFPDFRKLGTRYCPGRLLGRNVPRAALSRRSARTHRSVRPPRRCGTPATETRSPGPEEKRRPLCLGGDKNRIGVCLHGDKNGNGARITATRLLSR